MISNPLQGLSDNIRVDRDKCTFCGVCVETCILDNLRLQLAPCSHACPLGINCHGYVQLIARGEHEHAQQIMHERVPFSGILGRVCTHPCEAQCTRREMDGEPVAIRALKRFLSDRALFSGPNMEVGVDQPGRVAIVGSGPAGMMAAWDLRKQGHSVEVFEAATRPGGLLRWAIPDFRLPTEVVDREYGYLEALGVTTHLNTRVGQDVPFQHLLDSYDAVFIATGASASARLGIAGESAQGVYQGLEFLRQVKQNAASVRVGRQVIVVGGGNVAVDAAQVARRLGADSVRLVCLEQREEMPAFEWELADALAEGVEIACGWGPVRLDEVDGQVRGIEFQSCTRVIDCNGTFNPCYDKSETCEHSADTVIVAVGQRSEPTCAAGIGLNIVNGWIQADPITCQTNLAKVFAGGDAASGSRSVVHAMAAGKEAAKSIVRYLRGDDVSFGRNYSGPYITDFAVDLAGHAPQKQVPLPRQHDTGEHGNAELEAALSESSARTEAARCLNCGLPVGYYRTCWFCLPCEVECPENALWVDIPYLMR